MAEWVFYPPVAFLIILGVNIGMMGLLSRLAIKPRGGLYQASRKAYACGEDISEHKVQVNYSEFFPFAFFFTILHVITLMVATIPIETLHSFFIALLYIAGAVTGLLILFRR